MTAWWKGRMIAFDLETTSPLPEEARIVTAAVALCGGGQPTASWTWLADPGVEIPEEASAIHGVTTERARSEGQPLAEVVSEVIAILTSPEALAMPLVVFNARYDLTVMDRECARLGIPMFDIGRRVVDPMLLDKILDRYRKSFPFGKVEGAVSTRTLSGMCGVYGVRLDGAHDAACDALAAARIAYRMGQGGTIVRNARRPDEIAEKARDEETWARARHDVQELHDWQVELAQLERDRFAAYKRSTGDDQVADRVEAERGWPVLARMGHESGVAA